MAGNVPLEYRPDCGDLHEPMTAYQKQLARFKTSPRPFSPAVIEAQKRVNEQIASAMEAHARARVEFNKIWLYEAEALCPLTRWQRVWLSVTWVCWRKWARMFYCWIHRDCGRCY